MVHIVLNIFFIFLTYISFIECLPDISSTTACEGQALNIECAVGEVIVVKTANYGRTNGNVCQHSAMSNRNCHAGNSLNIATSNCNNKQKCSISASNGVFGDPCVGTYKYLTIEYQCFPGNSSTTACEGQALNIECAMGEVIVVKTANYGRTNGHVCQHSAMSNRNCHAGNSLNIASSNCNSKQKCSISASNGVFGDPCVGTYKYLTIEYECIPVSPCKIEEFQCNNGKCIPESAISDGIRDCPSGEDEQGQDYITAYACEGQTLNIYCKSDEIISVINANYGRLSPKICSHQQMSNQNCRAANSLQVINDRCNKKGFCSVPSTNQVFGDPCVNTYKYIEVHYECVKKPTCTKYEFQCTHGHCIDNTLRCDGKWDCAGGEDESVCPYLTEIACEHSSLNIECLKGHVIQIIGANYGRQQPDICTYQPTLNCITSVSKQKLENRCSGKRTCVIGANNAEFGDPCVGTIKYLSVNYMCINSDHNNIITPGAE